MSQTVQTPKFKKYLCKNGRRHVKSDQRIDQFMRLREIIEERASRKFFDEQAQADRPVVLRSNDFSS